MTKIIAFANHKGGVAKTTTSINVATGFANKGKKVLLIDFDPQANSTDILLDIKQDEIYFNEDIINAISKRDVRKLDTLIAQMNHYEYSEVFIDQMLMDDSLTTTYKTSIENLHIIPSRLDLAETEKAIRSSEDAVHNRLLNIILQVRDQYDYIFIDCAPIINTLTVNVLNVVDEVIIPIKIDRGAEKGYIMTIRGLLSIANSYRLDIHIRPLFTVVNRNNTDKNRIAAISNLVNDIITPIAPTIRQQPKAVTQSGYDNKLVINDTKLNVGKDYQDLVDYLNVLWND